LIAIVDDDEGFRASTRRLLRSMGYNVEAFPLASALLASPCLNGIACLIADNNMPGMTGVELHAHLVREGYEIPTILVTAYADEATRTRALKDGVSRYLSKPFDDNELMDCVRKAVEDRKPPAELS
jgi:FixJ family two-component response regulator